MNKPNPGSALPSLELEAVFLSAAPGAGAGFVHAARVGACLGLPSLVVASASFDRRGAAVEEGLDAVRERLGGAACRVVVGGDGVLVVVGEDAAEKVRRDLAVAAVLDVRALSLAWPYSWSPPARS